MFQTSFTTQRITLNPGLESYLHCVSKRQTSAEKFTEGSKRQEERQVWREGKRSVFILILLNEKAVKSSAIEGAKNERHWHGIFLSNTLFDRFFFFFSFSFWLIVLLLS